MIIWTIGGGGLFGQSLTRQALRHGIAVFDARPIPWDDPVGTREAMVANARAFRERAEDDDWAVLWAAGHAATAATGVETAQELASLRLAILALIDHLPAGRGAFFLSSSVGGIYAGSSTPPFNEHTPPRPLSPYGELKLAQEALATTELAGVCPVVIGRISNLYGPGQDLSKLQGLISRLALAAVTKQPITMFVSLDTIRDYIDVDDAAIVALHWAAVAAQNQAPASTVRVIASGQPVSLGALVHLMQDIARVRVPLAIGAHPSSAVQAQDLRVIPSNDGVAGGLVRTTLPAGVKRVYLDVLERWQSASVPKRERHVHPVTESRH